MRFRFVLLALILGITTGFAAVLTGRVTGVMTMPSKTPAAPVKGARVLLEGTFLSAETDADGRYVIRDVPHGIYKAWAMDPVYSEHGRPILVNADTVRQDWDVFHTDVGSGD